MSLAPEITAAVGGWPGPSPPAAAGAPPKEPFPLLRQGPRVPQPGPSSRRLTPAPQKQGTSRDSCFPRLPSPFSGWPRPRSPRGWGMEGSRGCRLLGAEGSPGSGGRRPAVCGPWQPPERENFLPVWLGTEPSRATSGFTPGREGQWRGHRADRRTAAVNGARRVRRGSREMKPWHGVGREEEPAVLLGHRVFGKLWRAGFHPASPGARREGGGGEGLQTYQA